jgi:hypothetical protein
MNQKFTSLFVKHVDSSESSIRNASLNVRLVEVYLKVTSRARAVAITVAIPPQAMSLRV